MLAYNFMAQSASPNEAILFLHGILGDRSNWRAIARQAIQGDPTRAALLVDLRAHGESQQQPPPHTVARCANDLVEVDRHLNGTQRGAAAGVTQVLGHSFGGKVAIAYAAARDRPLGALWVVDSVPGARPDRLGSESVLEVITALRQLPRDHASRDDFVRSLGARGIHARTANWLAKNLRRRDTGAFEFALDLDTIDALLDDYFHVDAWPSLEALPPSTELHFVVGDRSPVVLDADRRRMQVLASERARTWFHRVPEAGHWVHADAPTALIALLRAKRP